MNYEQVLLNLAAAAAAISRTDTDTSKIGEATNINKSREPFLKVPLQLLEHTEGSAIGLWLIDETDDDHVHQATLWQIVPAEARTPTVIEGTTNPDEKPAVAKIDSVVLKREFPLSDQAAIRQAFPLSLQDFMGTSARRLFASALGRKIDFSTYHDVLLPLRATADEKFVGVLQVVTPNRDSVVKLAAYFTQLEPICDIIAALIEAGRQHRLIAAIEKCQISLLENRSSDKLAIELAKELLVPCSALTCAVYRPGRGDTLERIAEFSDGNYPNVETVERGSFTYWIYERAIQNPKQHSVAHFANLTVAHHTPGAPSLKSGVDLPPTLTADQVSWLSYTVTRNAAAGFEGTVPILFIRLLTAPHRGFLGGSFSTTAREIVVKLSRHMSDAFSSLFELEANNEMRKEAHSIRDDFTEFVTKPDFLTLECEFAKLTRNALRCIKDVYIAQRSTASGALTTLRNCDAKPVTGMPAFAWSSRVSDRDRHHQMLDFKPYNGREGMDITVSSIGGFDYGLRCIFGGRVIAGYEGRVLAQIIDEMRIARMSTIDLTEKMRQTAEIRHALRAEMNGVLGHLSVASEIYELCQEHHRGGDSTIALRHLLDSAAFRKSMTRARLSSETLGSVLENSGIYMSEMRADKLQRSAVNIVQMLKDMRLSYKPELDRRRLKIVDHGTDNVVASCDARLVKMALFNLFDNAVKYAFNKYPIAIRAVDQGRQISVAMTNTGPYIEPTHLDAIFEPFKRVTFKGAQPMPGTGLGLPVARKIAEIHGGHVSVRSEPFRVGDVVQAETTFTFVIPKGFK